jgi:outer membrane protein TolC
VVRLLLSFFTILITVSQADAQATAASSTQNLSLKDCFRRAADKNPTLIAAKENAHSMDALYGASATNFFPQLSASIGYTTSSVGGTVPTPGSLTQVQTIQNQYSESITLSQSIFNGFTDIGKIKQGRANYRAAMAQVDVAAVTLYSGVKSAFAQLLFEQKAVDLTDAIWQRQIKNLRMIDLRFRGGSENKGSLLFQQATVSQARYQHDHAIRQLRNAAKQLGAFWGEPNNGEIRVEGDLAAHTPSEKMDFESLAGNHPNHVNYVELMKSADAYIEIEDGNWYPNLNFLASVGNVDSEWPPDGHRWSLGLTLTFPFFPGTSTYYGSKNARALKYEADAQLKATDYTLIATLENSYEALLDAVGQVSVAEEFQSAAEARSKIANGKYNTGLMTFEDWTVIDQDLVNREQTLLQSQLNAMQAEATWESAAGIRDF